MNRVKTSVQPDLLTMNFFNIFCLISDKNPLHYGGSSIVCAFGIRYKSYCSNLVRTLLVNPSEEMKNTYQFLLDCEEVILRELKHGIYLLVV